MTSNEGADNPIVQLTHDHEHLSDLVQAVAGALGRIKRGETSLADAAVQLEDDVESLREALLLHFAREEEGVFPFVEQHVPSLRDQVASLLADHDAVVAGAAELSHRLVTEVGRRGFAEGFDAFVAIYAAHSQAEHAFLEQVEAALDPGLREPLRLLLQGI